MGAVGLTGRRALARSSRSGESPFQPRRRAGDTFTPPPPAAPRRNPWARIPVTAVRIVATTLLMAGVAVAAANIFDDAQWSLLIPVGVTAAAVVAVTRLPARASAAARALTVVIAIVASAVAVTLVAGGTVGDALPGLVDGPRLLLTTEWPSPAAPPVLATVGALLAIATAVAVELARRRQFHLAPLAPVLVALVAVISLSAPRPPEWWLLATLTVLVVVLALARHGGRLGARLATLRGERAVAVTLVVVGVVGAVVATAVSWSGRADPRQVTTASRSANLLRSLEATVALREAAPPVDQFRVTDESPLIGQRMPTRWRTAALDEYDGQRWVPQVEVRPIGNRLAPDVADGPDLPSTGRYRIELLAAHTELVPLPGPPIELTGDPMPSIETDVDRVVVLLTDSAPAGTELRLVAEFAPTISSVAPAAIVAHPVGEFEAAFTEVAGELAGGGEALARLQRLEQELRSWQLDPDAPAAGQQQFLLEQFVFDTRRGTEEQFASAFVLLARSLGFDARVATGFVVPADEATSPLTVSSAHAAAWPEIHVADVGWLAFDPAPESVTGDAAPPAPQPEAQTPAAAQPPVEPPARPDTGDTPTDEQVDAADEGWSRVTTWALRVATAASLIALPAAVALAAIATVKLLRRRRRARHPDPSERVRAAWANATDALVDAGLLIEPSWTDDRIAAMGAPLAGSAPHELRRLATLSTAATFGAPAIPATIDDATAAERRVRAAMAAELNGWHRLRWRLSVRSLRRATRSPIQV